ncbi:hypothetical protein [Thermoflexus sp.]|uniref:hypothetical protein n=1 Tax=Thermoflexus sp. TaxID=1969742 RepID=UPI002ADDDC43|nr:hypothetical protein [Thermoflexus sp.]
MGFWKRRVSMEEQESMTPEARRQRLWEQAIRRLQATLPSDSPSWVLNETFDLQNDVMWLDVVMRVGPRWVKRRYRYDGEVDVLYFSGEVPFPETALDQLPAERMIWPSHPLSRLSTLAA